MIAILLTLAYISLLKPFGAKSFQTTSVDESKVVDPNTNPTTPLPGGYNVLEKNDEDVEEMAQFATNVISTELARCDLIAVVKAESQVVAGTNFKLILKLAPINTRAVDEKFICEVVVFDQPWTKTRNVTSFKCTSNEFNIVTEILSTIEEREELSPVVRYLNACRQDQDFLMELPFVSYGKRFFKIPYTNIASTSDYYIATLTFLCL